MRQFGAEPEEAKASKKLDCAYRAGLDPALAWRAIGNRTIGSSTSHSCTNDYVSASRPTECWRSVALDVFQSSITSAGRYQDCAAGTADWSTLHAIARILRP